MITAIFTFLSALLQAILEIFRATKKSEEQLEAARLQADRDQLNKALASGDPVAISLAFEKLRQRVLVQVPQIDKDETK